MLKEFPPVAELLPHRAPMIVIDAMSGADDDSVESITTLTATHPLFDESQNGLPGWALIELMAQTIALYGGLRAHDENEPVRIGYLLGTRRLDLHRKLIEVGESLHITARCEFSDPEGLGAFLCTVRDANATLVAEAKINVYQSKDGGIPA